MYVFFFAAKVLETLQLINKIKAWIVTNHNLVDCSVLSIERNSKGTR